MVRLHDLIKLYRAETRQNAAVIKPGGRYDHECAYNETDHECAYNVSDSLRRRSESETLEAASFLSDRLEGRDRSLWYEQHHRTASELGTLSKATL